MANDSREITDRSRNYRLLKQELVRRTQEPSAHPSFLIFFFLAVMVFGCFGVWWEIGVYFSKSRPPNGADVGALRTALMTVLPALVGSTALQAILAEDRRDFRAFSFLMLVFFGWAAYLIGPSSSVTNLWALWIGGPVLVFAWWIWWITNADQAGLKDDINPSVAIGGDNPKAELSGDLDGFNH